MGPISEQKEEPLLKKTELLLTIVRIARGELSFEIATSPPTLNVAKPPAAAAVKNRINQIIDWSPDWFICWSFNDPFKRLSPVPRPSLTQTKQKTKVNLSFSL